jgi:SHAQKYF class myb-like DNA-binding protein
VQYKPSQSRYWTAEEHERFLEAIKRFGEKDVKNIAALVGSRNPTQVRTHAQKYFLRLERDKRKQDDGPRRKDADSSPLLEPKKESKKRAAAKRRRSSNSDIQPSVTVVTQPPPRAPTPVLPPHIQQQIAAETRDSVLAQLKNWTATDYNLFIEGLVAFSDQKDIASRCKLISTHFLPRFSPEEIHQCFGVLSSVAKAKDSDEMEESKPSAKDNFPSFPQQPNIPVQYRGFGYPFRYPYVPGYPYHPEFMFGYPPERRAPYTPDPFSKLEATASEFYADQGMPSSSWNHSSAEPEYRAREQRE